jgi:hypothetical protein
MYSIAPALINSEPGILARLGEQGVAAVAFSAKGGAIHAIYSINNPEKLA